MRRVMSCFAGNIDWAEQQNKRINDDLRKERKIQLSTRKLLLLGKL